MKILKQIQKILQTGLHASLALVVAFVLTFSAFTVPKPTPVAEAGSLSGIATEMTQLANNALQSVSATQNTITAGATTQTAIASVGSFLKESVLDGIGWTIAKTVLSSMVRSLINWVNSGFEGSPAFITDIKQHLLGILDETAGEFIKSLGGIGEFVCSPFKLDVQAALSVNYAQARSGMPSGPDQNLCRASDIGSNIENFFEGTSSSWDDWFQVTANPQNTPLGAYYAAEASLNARLANEAGEEIQLANWGNGFLSQKVCQAVEGQSGSGNCTITTPGRVISEALTFSTSVGPRTLIEADEINELVGALLNQLILQVMQGVNGLLGLGGNSDFAAYDADGNTYLDAMVNEMGLQNIENTRAQIANQLVLELAMISLTDEMITEGETLLNSLSESSLLDLVIDDNEPDPDTLGAAVVEARDINVRSRQTFEAMLRINRTLSSEGVASTTVAERADALQEYVTLLSGSQLATESSITAKHTYWQSLVPELTAPTFTPLTDEQLELLQNNLPSRSTTTPPTGTGN